MGEGRREAESETRDVRPFDSRREPVDAVWYEKYAAAGNFDSFTQLDGDRAVRDEERRRFLAGKADNPRLDYPKIDPGFLSTREAQLLALKDEIITGEPNETVRQLYRWKINVGVAQIRMLRETFLAANCTDVAESQRHQKRFQHYSHFIYGSPSPEVFSYTLSEIRQRVNQAIQSSEISDECRLAAEQLLSVLPHPDQLGADVAAEIHLPAEMVVDQARAATMTEISDLVGQGAEAEELNPEQAKAVFEDALQSLQAEGWSVIIDPNRDSVAVSQERKAVLLPNKTMQSARLRSLIAHEIGTHVARRLNGSRSKLQLLSLGLDRYGPGEEGVATLREQTLKEGVTGFAGLDGHLAISLAEGLGSKPRTFREVYNILYRYFLFKQLQAGDDVDVAHQKAQTDAYDRCVRTFRGTGCDIPGVCYTKDIEYREGNIGVWDVVGRQPDELRRFSVGKYDPANPRHIMILDQLGITESDLSALSES